MVYSPTQDFLALLRQTSGGQRLERMPGLDYVAVALARMGLFDVWVNQSVPPPSGQATTLWVKPATSSFAVESTLWLYDADGAEWVPATVDRWRAFLAPATGSDVFQNVAGATATIAASTTLCAIQRTAPATTQLTLPNPNFRTRELRIVDFSTGVTGHDIKLLPPVGTIMAQPDWDLFSTADQLAGVTLYPSPDLNAWVIAP